MTKKISLIIILFKTLLLVACTSKAPVNCISFGIDDDGNKELGFVSYQVGGPIQWKTVNTGNKQIRELEINFKELVPEKENAGIYIHANEWNGKLDEKLWLEIRAIDKQTLKLTYSHSTDEEIYIGALAQDKFTILEEGIIIPKVSIHEKFKIKFEVTNPGIIFVTVNDFSKEFKTTETLEELSIGGAGVIASVCEPASI